MKQLPRPKLTYANVIASIALFLAIGGGAAYAATALPKNSVGTNQLKNGAVTGGKVKAGTLLSSDFKAGQLPANGATGPEGKAGADGKAGVDGKPGPEGKAGSDGSNGKAGAQGEPGERGPRGDRGANGAQGEPGERGARGEEGEKGGRGERGERGPQGEPGDTGPRGVRGFEGPEGQPGEPGPQGEPGVTTTFTRYGPEATPGKGPRTSYAACKKGETVTGGGYDFLETPSPKTALFVVTNRASLIETVVIEEEEEEEEETVYPAPKNGSAFATGWAVTIQTSGEIPPAFRAYVQCAKG